MRFSYHFGHECSSFNEICVFLRTGILLCCHHHHHYKHIVSCTETKISVLLVSLFGFPMQQYKSNIFMVFLWVIHLGGIFASLYACIIDARLFVQTDYEHLSCYNTKVWKYILAKYILGTTMDNFLLFLF